MSENETDPIYDLRFNINYYGADYPVESLVRRMYHGDFIIPNFQRKYVWKHDEASKFIESLLLGLPVPSIFLAKDKVSNQLIVIDGQQRLRTLQYFYDGMFSPGNPFKLINISEQFNGKTYQELSPEDRLNLDNTIIHCIIISENDDSNRIYYLFERLNTTGTPLNSQEIRNALYHGPLIDLLKEFSETELWENLYRKTDNRLEGEELILRFLALNFALEEYKGSLNQFLNDFMMKNRDFSQIPKEEFERVFHGTFEKIYKCIGNDAFYYRKKFNRVLFETLSITISQNAENLNCREIIKFHNNLIESDEIREASKGATTSTRNLLTRLDFAKYLLGNLK